MKRQGELLIIKVDSFEGLELNKIEHRILAEGETTGHKHELNTGVLYRRVYSWKNRELFFEVPENKVAILSHPEHRELTFETGKYKVITQREYEERGNRWVRD